MLTFLYKLRFIASVSCRKESDKVEGIFITFWSLFVLLDVPLSKTDVLINSLSMFLLISVGYLLNGLQKFRLFIAQTE